MVKTMLGVRDLDGRWSLHVGEGVPSLPTALVLPNGNAVGALALELLREFGIDPTPPVKEEDKRADAPCICGGTGVDECEGTMCEKCKGRGCLPAEKADALTAAELDGLEDILGFILGQTGQGFSTLRTDHMPWLPEAVRKAIAMARKAVKAE